MPSVLRKTVLALAFACAASFAAHAETHRSTVSLDAPLAIPDDGPPVGATLLVAGEDTSVFTVNVAANIRHRFRSHLEILLIAPDASSHVLREQGNSNIFGPALIMAVNFPAGIDPNGTWRLQVQDQVEGTAGDIIGFSIEVPESAESALPFVNFHIDPIFANRFVIVDEAGRYGAVANFRLQRSGRIKALTSLEIFSSRLGESVKLFFRKDGTITLLQSSRGKVSFSKPKGSSMKLVSRLKGFRRNRGTREVGEGHYAAFAELQQASERLGLLYFNVLISSDPNLYRDYAGDFIRAAARAASHTVGVMSSVFPVEGGDPLQTDTAIIGSLVAAVDDALDLDSGGPASFFLVNPIASELATDESFRQLIEARRVDVAEQLEAGMDLAASVYPSLGKATPPLLFTMNETVAVTSGPKMVETLLFNPYADGTFTPELNLSWAHGEAADNTEVFDREGFLFGTGIVSGTGGAVLPLTGRERYLVIQTTAAGDSADFSFSVFFPEEDSGAL